MTAIEQPAMTIPLAITLRAAVREDLPKLEWYGQYTHYRNLFRRAYREQQLGRRLMLVADCNNFPIGHIFIQFINPDDGSEGRAYLYSFRVMEMFRGQGIGTRLMQEAEAIIRQHGFSRVTISVARNNPGAKRLYERLGYRVFSQDEGRWRYVDHHGSIRTVHEPCWMLHKQIHLR